MSELMEKFTVWKTRLLDTSRRNRLLYFGTRRGHVQVIAPDADEIFDALAQKGRKLTFVAREEGEGEVGKQKERDGEAQETSSSDGTIVGGLDSQEISANASEDRGVLDDLPIDEARAEIAAMEGIAAPISLVATASSDESEEEQVPVGVGEDGAALLSDGSQSASAEGAAIEDIALPDALMAMTGMEESGGEQGAVAAGQEISHSVQNDIIGGGRRNELRTDLSEAVLTTTLYNLRAHARTALEEQGVNVLFLSFGMLHWVDPTTREAARSPLLLVPVQLERGAVTQPFTLTIRDEDILLNPTLTHKLYVDFRIQLPRLPEESELLTPRVVFELIQAALPNLPTWTITPEVYLELYSFEKLVMLRDLDAHVQEIDAHPVLLALAGDPSHLPPSPTDLPKARELDDRMQPVEHFQVLDADSSQQVAIEWAKRGASFVIEGPPGTGKSQTIANIIAEALAQNKKVLFVSAKMAALDVVAKRLAQCGLANFYLEAHSHHSSRGALVAQLGQALYETYPEQAPALEHLTQLGQVRAELNAYARALHTPVVPLNQTPFHAYTVLSGLADAPELYFDIAGMAEIDARNFAAIDETLDNLAARGDVWEQQEEHPWRGVMLGKYTFQARTEIEYRFGELMRALTALETAAEQVAEAFGLTSPRTLEGIERLAAIAKHALETPMPPSGWFRAGETVELRAMALDAQKAERENSEAYSRWLERYTEALLERTDLADMRGRLETAQGKTLRILDGQYRQDMAVVRAASKGQDALTTEQAIEALQEAQELQAQKGRIEARQADYQARFERAFNGRETEWGAVLAQLDWVDEMMALYAPESVPEGLTNLVCNRPARLNALRPPVQALDAAREEWRREWEYLTRLFPEQVGVLFTESPGEVRGWLALRLERIGDLEAWLALQADCDALEGLGGGAFLESARAAKLQGDQLKPAFLKRFYPLWLDAVYAQVPVLEQSEEVHRKRVAQFWRADVEQLTIARERLVQQLATARPAVGWSDAPSSEVTLLKREMAKRKHHKSIRRLAAEIPNLLLALKPCLMMSPLSVSQYLATAPVTFDLVIFDEASQIPPEEAVTAIVRAKQIIVAGDHQQLPPTPFFQTLGELEDQEITEPAVLESLLQEASIVLPSVRLMWHYRSRHEALLGFSNHYFYEDRLVTFPNAAVHDARLGVEFVYVREGVYDRANTRTNEIEARRVAELVLEHFTQSPERSLGIVTFSQAQRGAIDLELQKLLREHPELETSLSGKGSEGFFVKSLENVQGDERDVMFFSVGYGKDAHGTLTMNFGPLNGQDGARRLNVAVTRARDQVKLVSSLLPGDLDPARTNSRGVQLLRAYMEYAAREGRAAWTVAPTETDAFGDEEELRQLIQGALRERGFEVRTRVGSGSERVDLALVDAEDPERYALGIELEGDGYRSANTARERERLRNQVLQQLGWKVYRLRARDWMTNRDVQLERIGQMVAVLETPEGAWGALPGRGKNSQRANAAANGNGTAGGALVPTGMAIYAPVALARQGTPEQFFRANERTFHDLFVQLAEQEGPIHWNAAARRIAGCWGIPRVTPAVESHLDGMLAGLIAQGRVLLRDDFLWSPVTMDVVVRQPAPGDEPRPIEEIALEEIARAAYLNLKNALSLTQEDWVLLTARLLGYPRASERVKRRIGAAVEKLVDGGIVKVGEGKVELGE